MNIPGADRTLVWALLFVIAAWFLLWKTLGPRQKGVRNLPPGPRNWPLNMGAFTYMEPAMHKTFEKMAAKFGPIVHFRLGVQTVVVVSSSDAAEELLRRKDAEFLDRATAMTSTTDKYIGLDGEMFVFCNYDAQFKAIRKAVMTEFFTVAKVKSYEELRRRETAAMVENILAMGKVAVDDAKDGLSSASGLASWTVDVNAVGTTFIQNLLFDLVCGTRFDGLPPNARLRQFPELLEEVMELVMKISMVDFFPVLKGIIDPQGILKQFKDFHPRFSGFLQGVVDDRRQLRKLRADSNNVEEEQQTNFIDVLLSLQEQEGKLSDNAVNGTFWATLAAGVDTVATAVEWTMLELLRHPEIMRKLRDEVDGVVGKERAVNEEDLQSMPLLEAVVTESFRLHPPVPVSFAHVNSAPSTLGECLQWRQYGSNELKEPSAGKKSVLIEYVIHLSATELSSQGGYHIPANTAVFVNFYGIGRDPKTWKDPLQFTPTRHMQEEDKSFSNPSVGSFKRLNGTHYHLLPFGGGRRMCTGFNLAIVTLSRCVATLVHAFDWGLLPGQRVEDLDNVKENGRFILARESRLLLNCKPRLSRSIYNSCL